MKRTRRPLFSHATERRAVLYARYSSQMQQDSWSIDAQLADLRTHCERQGWPVTAEYLDEAISGATDQRPGLQQAITAIREGRATVLVVHKLDRFSRSMKDVFNYIDELDQYGAGLVCTQQPIDTTNPVSGKIVVAVMAALAEIYLDNLSEETSKGKRARAASGLGNGDLPFGYCNPDRGKGGESNRTVPAIVPEAATAIRRAFTLYATGQQSDARIARALNSEGYRIVSKWQPNGGPFGKDTITAMLANPFYAGWVVQPGLSGSSNRSTDAPLVRGKHPAIIEQSLFDAVQALRAARRGQGRRGSPTRQSYIYVGSGIVHCRACKRSMRAQGQAARGPTYRCTSLDRGLDCTCTRKSIPARLVEATLGDAVAGLILAPDWRDQVLAAVDEAPEEAAKRQAQREALERKRDRLQRLLIEGDISRDVYRRERQAVDEEVAQLTPVEVTDMDREAAAARIADLARVWEESDPEERRSMAATFFDAVYCDTDERRVVGVQLKKALQSLWSALPKAFCTQCGSDGRPVLIPYMRSLADMDTRAA